ncbi:ComEA family DNA-binding protein [Patescibacteria group bacterium]|nr:ComEA family DNA-binding protein [Patescibacteria group bacterium]
MKMVKLLDKLALPIGIVLLISLLAGAYFLNRTSADAKVPENQQLMVDVAGAVNNPGVYQFDNGAIIEDAIIKAGGLTEDADLSLIALTINRAALLTNNGKVYLPIIGAKDTSGSTTSSANPTKLVNINTADANTLDTLPGIGPVYAGRIIDYRQQHGNFQRKEDLQKVSGISASTYNNIKDKITI